MNYVEIITGVKDKPYHSNDIHPITDVKNVSGRGCFRSLYIYTDDLVNYVKRTGSVEKYNGEHSADALLFDFDGEPEEFEDVRKEVIKLVDSLHFNYDIPLEYIYISFSGGKGFHVAIPTQVIGGVTFHKRFYAIYKKFIEHLVEGFKFADTGIYNPMRVMRIINTQHEKTGLYKIPLTYQELINKNFNIRATAKHARNLDDRLPISEMEKSPVLEQVWFNLMKLDDIERQEKKQVVQSDKQFSKALSSKPSTGGRHDALTKIVGYLIDRNVEYDEALAICKVWDQQLDDPLGERLEEDVKGMFNSYWDRRPNKKTDEVIPVENLLLYGAKYTDRYQEHIARINKFGRIKTGYPAIDEPMRGMIAGEVGLIIGKTSVGKSAFAQNILLNNVEQGRRVLFFSLEMPAPTVIERNLQMKLGISGREIERRIREGDRELMIRLEETNLELENFITIPTQGVKYPLIERYIKETEDYFGEKIDVVLLDYAGLIQFEGGSLYEQQTGIAKDLKALSGRTETGIWNLVQVSKQYKDTDPLDLDSSRDSGSIMEACDYAIGWWRANRYNPYDIELDGGLLKSRNGSRVNLSGRFSKKSLRFQVEERSENILDKEKEDKNEPF